jgi:hypothetical protein
MCVELEVPKYGHTSWVHCRMCYLINCTLLLFQHIPYRVHGPYSDIYLIMTPKFEWCVVRLNLRMESNETYVQKRLNYML